MLVTVTGSSNSDSLSTTLSATATVTSAGGYARSASVITPLWGSGGTTVRPAPVRNVAAVRITVVDATPFTGFTRNLSLKNRPAPVLISPPVADTLHANRPAEPVSPGVDANFTPSVTPQGTTSIGSSTESSYMNVIDRPVDVSPIELLTETTISTFVSVNELVSFNHTRGANFTATASVGSLSLSIGDELPVV